VARTSAKARSLSIKKTLRSSQNAHSTTRPESRPELGVTRYRCKVWPYADPEPGHWTWEHIQTSASALQTGGVALLAHHLDVTFGDVSITALPEDGPGARW